MRTRMFVGMAVLSIMCQLIPATASSFGECDECRYIPSLGEFWCTVTDCDASDICIDTYDHSYCTLMGSCDGSLPKWLCELYPSSPCAEPLDPPEPQEDGARQNDDS